MTGIVINIILAIRFWLNFDSTFSSLCTYMSLVALFRQIDNLLDIVLDRESKVSELLLYLL